MGSGGSKKTLEIGDKFWKLGRFLGRGAFGEVFLLKHEESKLALKMIDKRLLLMKGESAVRGQLAEKELLQHLDHPLLVNLRAFFETRSHLLVVLDFMECGDLYYHIQSERKRNKFEQHEVRFVVACVLLALEELHRHKIVHRDLKPENIMIDGDGYAHVGDLNVAKEVIGDQIRGKAGTLSFMAPEVIKGLPYAYEADVWSLGICMYRLLFGRMPWKKGAQGPFAGVKQQTRSNSWDSVRDVNNQSGKKEAARLRKERQIADFHNKIGFDKFPGPSTSASELDESCRDCLQAMLRPQKERISVADLKRHPFFAEIDWDKLRRKELKAPWIPPSGKANLNAEILFEDQFGTGANVSTVTANASTHPLSDKEQNEFCALREWISPALTNILTCSSSTPSSSSSSSPDTDSLQSSDERNPHASIQQPAMKASKDFKRSLLRGSTHLRLSRNPTPQDLTTAASSSAPTSSSSSSQALCTDTAASDENRNQNEVAELDQDLSNTTNALPVTTAASCDQLYLIHGGTGKKPRSAEDLSSSEGAGALEAARLSRSVDHVSSGKGKGKRRRRKKKESAIRKKKDKKL